MGLAHHELESAVVVIIIIMISIVIWQMQVHQFKTDPLMDQGPMRVRTGRAFLDAFARIAKPTTGARTLTLPILMVASKTDQVNKSNSINNKSSIVCPQ